jgi:uncharacterized protein YutE (UPF0331/DUF86 family)
VTDLGLVEKKLALAEGYVADLRRLAQIDRIAEDVRERRFVEHTLQLAIQACLDAASHLVSIERLGEPKTNRALFHLLAQAGWIDGSTAETMFKIVGFRNILVHGYASVDLGVVRDVVEHRLGDLIGFVEAVRRRMHAGG